MPRILTFAALVLILLPLRASEPTVLDRPLPERWTFDGGIPQPMPSDDAWWSTFGDNVLDSLISMGVDANYDVAMAARRMDAASRSIAVARAAYFPQLGLNASYTRSGTGHESANRYALEANMSWEIDLFGKITAKTRQSKAQYRASRAEWTGAMVSMAGKIASTYMQLRVWEAELQVARDQSVAQDSIARIVFDRYDCGLGAKPQVDQANALVNTTRATIPALETSVATAKAALALLVGRYVPEIEPLLSQSAGLPDYRRLVGAGVPSELLRRRPDIAVAEANLAAAAAALGIASKEFLPTLTLEGSVGVAAPRPGDMFTRDGFGYSVAPTLSWTVFDGMARRAGVAAARDEMEARLAEYNYTVMNAYMEVENAMTSYINYVKQISEYEQAVESTSEFLSLELDLYRQGLAPYSDVATAQQNVLNHTNSLIVARGNALTALVTLYEALGGGFDYGL